MPRNRSACRSSTVGSASGSYQSRRARRCDVLGERLGEPVGQRLHHDRLVVVALGLVAAGPARRRRGWPRRTRRGGRRPARGSRRGTGWAGPPAWRSAGAASAAQRHLPGRRTTMSSPSACAGQNPYPPRAVSSSSAMIWSSSAFASSNRSRAAGWSRIAGYLPFSSQARKKNCQSMSSRSAASGRLDRTYAGERRAPADRRNRPVSRLARACARRQQRLAAPGLVLLAQPLLLGPVGRGRGPRPGSGRAGRRPRRRPGRRPARARSGASYAGAIAHRGVLARRGGAADQQRRSSARGAASRRRRRPSRPATA